MRECDICGVMHRNRSGAKKPDGTYYYARKCYSCSKSHPGRRTIEERFFSKFKKTDGCWNWEGTIHSSGYGFIGIASGKHMLAHRFSYRHFNGELPDDMLVCHKCDNPRCVNPAHLFLGTHKDNMDDMKSKGRAVSLRGEDSPHSIINERQAREIYADSRSYRKIAKLYGISCSTVSAIKNKRAWKHIHAESVC